MAALIARAAVGNGRDHENENQQAKADHARRIPVFAKIARQAPRDAGQCQDEKDAGAASGGGSRAAKGSSPWAYRDYPTVLNMSLKRRCWARRPGLISVGLRSPLALEVPQLPAWMALENSAVGTMPKQPP